MAQVVIPGFRKIETCKEGTGDYNNLSNIPFINNVLVKGSLKTEDLKLTDSTLTKEGVPADAKATGDAIAELKNENTELKSDLINQNNKINAIGKKQIKHSILDIKKNFYQYTYPSDFLGTYKPLDVFTDGTSYFAEFNESEFKHSGGTTYYTGKNGIWSNNGLTPDEPTSLRNAIVNLAQNGDTVFVSEGVYGTEFLMNIPYIISKGINIVGENDNVVFVYGNKGTFTYDDENQCYKARGLMLAGLLILLNHMRLNIENYQVLAM